MKLLSYILLRLAMLVMGSEVHNTPARKPYTHNGKEPS